MLARLPLDRINPFRLIAIFPGSRRLNEWRWNLKQLEWEKCAWQPQQWISSGFDEPAAQRERHRAFLGALGQRSAGSLGWLRRLHGLHAPEQGPFSTCMHRAGAATVSYSEVVVLSGEGKMWHCLGAPCRPEKRFTTCFEPTANTSSDSEYA